VWTTRTQYALVLLTVLVVLGAVVVGTAELFQQQTIDQEREDLDETAALATPAVPTPSPIPDDD
jgi:hypothetical protein